MDGAAMDRMLTPSQDVYACYVVPHNLPSWIHVPSDADEPGC